MRPSQLLCASSPMPPAAMPLVLQLFEYGLSAKWLELLKEIAPQVTRAGVLRDPVLTTGIGQFAAIQSVAPSLGVEAIAINLREADEIERSILGARLHGALFPRPYNHRSAWRSRKTHSRPLPRLDPIRPVAQPPTASILATLPSQVRAGNGVNSCNRTAIISITAR
jgi:hypothetical protein